MTITANDRDFPQRFFGVEERVHHNEDAAARIVAPDATAARMTRSDCPEETEKPSRTTGAQMDLTGCWRDRVVDGGDELASRGMERVRLLVVRLSPN